MIAYPVSFPCASRIEGHGATQSAGLVRTPMQAGNARQRRSHRVLPHQISLVFVMPQAIYSQWLGWVNRHAWDEWVLMDLPGLAAGTAGTDTAPTLVRFCSDLQSELLPVHRLWYWRVRVAAEYQPGPDDFPIVGDWIVGGVPAAPSPDWVLGGRPGAPAPAFTNPGTPALPVVVL